MKETSKRSKQLLKPISPIIDKKSVLDYQKYEQQLASFQEGKKPGSIANLFDWTKPSEVISLRERQDAPRQQEVLQNNSMNTEQLLRSQGENQGLQRDEQDDSFEVQLPTKPTYAQIIKREYGAEYRNMSNTEIEGQLKTMRQQILQMNQKLNKMLDKYELLSNRGRQQAIINNPHKMFTREIETNNRILTTQAQEIKQIQDKEKMLQKKDYLVQLNQLIIEVAKNIHDIGKQKHHRWVDVERIDRLLKEIEDIQGTEEQFRQVKQLKIKIIFYFKKLKAQKLQEEECEDQIQKLINKDNQISSKLDSLVQKAIQNSLEVSTNKKYLEVKKKYQQTFLLVESAKKKKDITIKFQQVAEQKLQREIQAMKKQIQKIQLICQQYEYKAISTQDQTNQMINKYNLLTKDIQSVSYRFDQSLIHPEKKFKPDFKRVISRMEGKDVAKTSQYATQSLKSNKTHTINDKNMTIQEISSNAQRSSLNESKLKPILRQWRKKSENARYPQSPTGKYKTIEASNIFKPPLLLRGKK